MSEGGEGWRDLSEEEFAKLGFKCGLEIHHQIKTGQKLFCRCPAVLRRDPPHTRILRHMRPTMSELGVYDGTALMEFKTKKNITYHIYRDTVCTYEFDDTPPFPVNQEAVDIAIHIAMLLNCSIVDELHVSRKQYLDGSIPTGFQRTMIVGVNGWLPYKDRKIGIIQLALEEDACRQVTNWRHDITFKTDRLSIPLVEVVTRPDIMHPREVPEVANAIGRLLRATGLARRGDGSVRQDINVSINGGTRVEIKGVPKLAWMTPLTRIEALRQKALLELRDELARRGITKDTFRAEIVDCSSAFRSTAFEPIKRALEEGGEVLGVRLEGYKDILNYPTQPGKTFASELAGRVRVIACIEYEPVNILHTDEMPKLGSTEEERRRVLELCGAGPDDVVVLVWGNLQDATTAAQEVRTRALELTIGVPNETRQPLPDGTTDFERILPGPDRMYPDTDSPPYVITKERLGQIARRLGETPDKRMARYEKLGIPRHVGWELAIHPRALLFDRLLEELNIDPKFAAAFLVETMKALARRGIPVDQLSDDVIAAVFRAYKEGRLAREGVELAVSALAARGGSVEERVAELASGRPGEEELAALVKRAVESVGKRLPPGRDPFGAVMGFLMAQLRGKVGGARLAEMVRCELEAGAVRAGSPAP
ncbi:MAG: Glu-tRNA(Gln) amidotransferase subunit GatE [Thermoplasmata archaeon]